MASLRRVLAAGGTGSTGRLVVRRLCRLRIPTRILTRDRRRAIRFVQWMTAGVVYIGCFATMAAGIDDGWMDAIRLAWWSAFVGTSALVSYVALRTGWSERFRDPALTEWQIVMATIAIVWGYLICGPMRTVALLPLLLVFLFGAFALPWRRIALLTIFAVGALGVAVAWLKVAPPAWRDHPPAATLPIDDVNYMVVLIVLPAIAVIAARLSALRNTLRARRARIAAWECSTESTGLRSTLKSSTRWLNSGRTFW